MSIPQYTVPPVNTVPLKMPAGSSTGQRKASEGSRSSRRRIGSSGPPVVLGGGAGVLGKAGTSSGLQQDTPPPPFCSRPAQTSSPRSSYFPVQFPSPVSPDFASSMPQYSMYTQHAATPPAPDFSPGRNTNPGSTNSLSTTASSSSRTLKTPASKPAYHRVAIASSSGSHDSHADSRSPEMPLNARRAKELASIQSASPTPVKTARRISPLHAGAVTEGRRSSERVPRDPASSPAFAQGPLPPVPSDVPSENRNISARGSTLPGRVKHVPPPLDIRKENRLSQDWVQITFPEPLKTQMPERSKISMPDIDESKPPPQQQARLPPATMVAMKQEMISPRRPVFERTNTAPALSPTREKNGRPQFQTRASFDQIRSDYSSTARTRQTSMSTPPEAVLEGASQASGGRLRLWRSGTPKTPELRSRRSEDALRPSLDGTRSVSAPTKKELKAAQIEAQRNLGIASTVNIGSSETDRKSSGLSLKKSSGALKALFGRGASGKGKETADTPPIPSLRGRPSTAPTVDERPVFGRPKTPRSTAPGQLVEQDPRGFPSPYQGRHSTGVDRAMNGLPAIAQRHASQGSHPMMRLPSRPGLPDRDLPQLPATSPLVQHQPSFAPRGSPDPVTQPSVDLSGLSKLGDALPASSLPYLDAARISRVLNEAQLEAAMRREGSSPGSTLSTSTARPSPFLTHFERSPGREDSSPAIKTSRSLHLLQVPELDLDFDMSFDRFGASPSTPRKMSPRKSPKLSAPTSSPTPVRPNRSPKRSITITARNSPKHPPQLHRPTSERRRSKSFDGVGATGSPMDDFWRALSSDDPAVFMSPSKAKAFASTSSSSAPLLSQPLSQKEESEGHVPTSIPMETERPQSRSFSSHPCAPSSSDHARTPSNASSTSDTESPSPPRTPERRDFQIVGLGLGDIECPPSAPMRTPTGDNIGAISQEPVDKGKKFALNAPPCIPLPATPGKQVVVAPAELAPAAVIDLVQPLESGTTGLKPPRENVRVLLSRSKVVTPDQTVSNRALAREIERVLYSYRYPSQQTTPADRANLIRNELLSSMIEVDKRTFDNLSALEEGAVSTLREICFQWAEMLLAELRVEQAANERGVCLEGLAAVLESSCLSEKSLRRSSRHREMFKLLMMECMTFVMIKLGAKGVFHNTLLFSGRFLAFAFFRIPHVAEQLVTVLQPPRGALMRFTRASLGGHSVHATAQPEWPDHLKALCFDDSRVYTARLATLCAEFATEAERDAFLFQPGNWLRRWQSDDSELFPAFYRAYHRQLALYLAPAIEHFEMLGQRLPASLLLRAPGYAHLATIFAKKCHSYILGSVNAVTTSSSAQNFEATETAGFRGSQKPAVLETANRRLVETISTFANACVTIPTQKGGVIECDGSQLWADMIDLWTKHLISKTSLYAPKGVFSLFDLLDGIVDPPLDPTTGERCLTAHSLLDVPHLIYVIRMVLTQGEHALTLVKVIAFVFTHWEVLTARADDRRELCLELLLERKLFERLLLFWSQSVRSYVLRLVVFRLGHLHTTNEDGQGHEVEIETVRVLQTRLARIKKRHDELEPRSATFTNGDDRSDLPVTPTEGSFPRSKSTITMIAGSPRTGSANKAERLLGLGLGMDVKEEDSGRFGKATNWLKKSFAPKKKKRDGESPSSSVESSPTLRGSSPGPSPSLQAPSPSLGRTSPALQLSPGAGTSPSLGASLKTSPALPPKPRLQQSALPKHLPSPTQSQESEPSPTDSVRKTRPPMITTTSPTQPCPSSPNAFSFEFELPTMSPRSDTFDPPPVPSSPRRASAPPSPRQPPSPHMSRSFSKRSSLLPPSTANALDAIVAQGSTSPLRLQMAEEEEGYEPKFHAYAIRMLAELEDAQKEYDEWWSEGGVGTVDGCPPRLTVAWPFHEGED